MKQASSWYRPDIDGLRAVAVLGVLFYHFGVRGFNGGFTGVDVFFVISGYLITSVLLRDFQKDSFSMIRFWERRVRRIVPALFVVLVVTSVTACFVLLFPPDFTSYGKSLVAQSLFVANFYFIRQTNYFAQATGIHPLLHTWTLSVEEQFYVVFPIFLYILYRFLRRYLRMTLGVVTVISFAFSLYLSLYVPHSLFSIIGGTAMWGGATNETVAFYFLLSRAWELCVGALLAASADWVLSKRSAEVLSVIGLAFILFGFFHITSDQGFSAMWALLPVIGTTLLIATNKNNATSTKIMLSWFPFVSIGLMSYSLYLWHWPLYVLSLYAFQVDTLTTLQSVTLMLFAGSLAFVTYRLVELPFQQMHREAPSYCVILVGLGCLVLLGGAGFAISRFGTVIHPVPDTARRFLDTAAFIGTPTEADCVPATKVSQEGGCLLGMQKGEDISFVVWGDSHAINFTALLGREAKARNLTGIAFIIPSCTPLPLLYDDTSSHECLKKRQEALMYIQQQTSSTVLLIGRWDLMNKLPLPASYKTVREYFSESIQSLVVDGSVRQLFIMQQVPPQPQYSLRRGYINQLAQPNIYLDISALETSYESYTNNLSTMRSVIQGLAVNNNKITLIDPGEVFCSDGYGCKLTDGVSLLYQDDNHVSPAGVALLEPLFTHFFNAVSSRHK